MASRSLRLVKNGSAPITPAGPQLDQVRKSGIDVAVGVGIENMKLYAEDLSCRKKSLHSGQRQDRHQLDSPGGP